MKILIITFIMLLQIAFSELHAAKVGLCIMATGKYIVFVKPLIDTARQYFCPGHSVTYFVFTDQALEEESDIVRIEQARLGWPYDTLMRNSVYFKNRDKLEGMDYIFALDADMKFVGIVGNEILGERVATLHPGFIGKRGTYETNPNSLACIYDNEGDHYFAGGFFGGSRDEFFHITSETTRRINDDLQRGFIAVWHDESHWNRFCIDFKPTVILDTRYCSPQYWEGRGGIKIIALDKNHAAFRG